MENLIFVSSWCGKFFCTSFSLIACILIANIYIPLLPFGALYIFLYLLLVSLLTVWITCVIAQKFLKRTKPFAYPKNTLFFERFFQTQTGGIKRAPLTDLEERISEFSSDIEKQFVRKWFKHITDDELFCEECRVIIADATRRFLQIVVLVDGKQLLHGVLIVLLKHLKEYRRSRRRCEKNGGSIEQAYRFAHVASKSMKSQEFFIHKLSENFLKQFISWELWNSLPCRTLVAVLSRKLVNYLLIHVAKPGFLNYRILKLLASETTQRQLDLEKYSFVSTGDVVVVVAAVTKESFEVTDTPKESPFKAKTRMVVSQPVKIHQVKATSKTWCNSSDLECVSLGQDPLVTANFSDENKKLWNEPLLETSAVALTALLKPTETASNIIENVTTTIFQQETVSNIVKPVSQATTSAMLKIGDLQDEAAGVMEGIFDFGMAGIRKGLRLTGLQENSDEKTAKRIGKAAKKLAKWPQVVMDDSVWINPLNSPNFEGDILLEKSPVTEQKIQIPQISTDSENVDSPEPEYEEPADFATTIAKLRSLLQQKSSESSLTTPAVSPMPQDDRSSTTPSQEASDVNDGVMPSLYKFCAKTATGMFQNTINTLKTALPGNASEQQVAAGNWTYVASDATSNDTISRIKRLLAERREFCTVDTAYEAIDSLNIEENNEDAWTEPPPPFDDDLDDFEQQVPLTKALLDVFCELIADSNTSFAQESVVRSILVLMGQKTEEFLENQAEYFVRNVNRLIGRLPTTYNAETLPMKFEKFLEICLDSCPSVLKQLLSHATVARAFELFLLSFQSQRINEDVFLQIFELVAQQVIAANAQLTPTFSA